MTSEAKSHQIEKLDFEWSFIPIILDDELLGVHQQFFFYPIKRYWRIERIGADIIFSVEMGSDDERIAFNFKIKGNIILFSLLSTVVNQHWGSIFPAKAFLGIGNTWRLEINLALMFLVFTHFLLFSTFSMLHLLTIFILLIGKYFDTTYMIYALIFKFIFLIKESKIAFAIILCDY